jgi:hypothetical protein
MTRYAIFLPLFLVLVFLTGCASQAPVCPAESGTPNFLTIPPGELPTPASGPASAPVVMEIRGKVINVDKVVEGPLCNGTWSGTVYVACNVQVYQWEGSPNFLQNCNLTIEPGTVVYVAHHNDTAYYNGCSSCHTGEVAEP